MGVPSSPSNDPSEGDVPETTGTGKGAAGSETEESGRPARARRVRQRPRLIRGTRLVTKLLLVGLPLALLFVPWFSYLMLEQIEAISVQMQSNHQLLIADSIAIHFNKRDDLFNDLPLDPSDSDLVARPIQTPVRLNASSEDWGQEAIRPRQFGDPGDGSFALILGTRREERADGGDMLMLYAYLEITDDVHVYRNPDFLRLDNADHVRVSFLEADGEPGRIAVTLSDTGDTTAYRMDPDWAYAVEGGLPEYDVRGFVRETDTGYALELRMPFDLVGSRRSGRSAARSGFGLSFVDVDDPATRSVRAITETLPTSEDSLNLVVHRSPDVLNILEGLGFSGMRIRIVDAKHRERADIGDYRTGDRERPSSAESPVPGWLAALRDGLAAGWKDAREWLAEWSGNGPDNPGGVGIDRRIVESALAGEPIALRRREGDVETIMAGHPIISEGNAVIGAVVVEENIDDIQFFQRRAINNLALVSLGSFLAVLVCLILYAGRLTWRIRSLRREVTTAIDEFGRLQTNSLTSGISSADEIGDLSRSVSNMLTRLEQHNTFLQKMPRTLRHEINNPLNVLITSLDQLAKETGEVRDSKYLESARRGVLRIGAIVQNLADAASLEESLASEDMEVIDIHALIESYMTNCRVTYEGQQFAFRSAPGPIHAKAADYRIEQMLDKLVDNAVDFHRANSPIHVQLDIRRGMIEITVANRGPMLPPDPTGSLFESMVSRRAPESRLHFGLGLYVVRVIAEQHGGSVWAMNLADGSGVAFMVRLPLAPSEVKEEVDDTAEAAAAGR